MISSEKGNSVYLRNKLEELIKIFGDENINRYIDFYEAFPVSLQRLLSLLHYEFNRLLKYLNGRLQNGHYTAHESRDLIYLIDEFKTIQSNLKGSELDFDLTQDYKQRLTECEDFLRESGGSPIPNDFEKVNITENEQIFYIRTAVKVPRKGVMTLYQTKVIGEGSYARVHKYKDEYYNRFFVIKKALKNLNEKELERFKREFEEMKKLNSPYVIEVYNFDEENNQYTMEYADETLEDFISKNNTKLNVNKRISLVRQILQAFIYINSKGVLHRDISTKNILIKKYEGVNIIKVSDFGLVKIPDSTLTSKNTEFKGSLNDPKLEIIGFDKYEAIHETYALTRLIYFVMTGRRTIGSFNSEEFENFVMKGISDNIDERYKDVEELRNNFVKIKAFN
ncbi:MULTISPECIES: protein kinase domain-containing protein [Bacillus subtilis group]|uniref:protein kinase domain-containing protein n=1 Tax=Bacillus subtilis group TaxID=653685 RepID=UPI0005EFF79E|nr:MULTISPECIES: protein kinase [Bacillus subtilis group]MCY8864655.1 protein kinase [Bacillus spizizenii]MDL2031488.1 protein kinase [Bacillus subtilis]TAH79837.1 protein kinase family protein [Bacillus subtilis]TAH86872.1 protein kinase family protein [Bacillus subtilis]TWG63388.1 protein kinase-like protein [Bacillus subtilis J24]